MNTLLKPERLSFGDTVGIVAPASPPPDPKAVDGAIEALERHGFKPKLGKHVRERHGFWQTTTATAPPTSLICLPTRM